MLMEEIIPKIARDLNILTQENPRKVKLNSMQRISNELKQASSEILENSPWELVKVLNHCLSDSVEGLRESAGNLLLEIVMKLPKDKLTPILSIIIPTLQQRLGNKDTLIESSEEIRLLLVKLLRQVIIKSQSDFNNYVEQTVEILKIVLADPYQGVKKEACGVVELLSISNSRALGMFGDSVVKSVLPCLGHRHSAVRIMGLQALKAAMIVNLDGLDAALTHLWPLTMDNTGNVREKLYAVAGEWLLELPDRYSIGYKILPLLLAGLQDEMPSLREKSRFYIDEAGKLYESEWESRVKDEVDYSDGRDLDSNRPRVGCRHLARDNTLKIVEKVVEGLTDWTPEKRSKSAQILTSFLDYTEDKISGYTANILNALYKIMAGDESHCEKLCQNLGKFVSPEIYLDLIMTQIKTGGGGAIQFLIGSLKVLANLLKGSTISGSLEIQHISKIVALISTNDIISNENIFFRIEMANVLNAVLGNKARIFNLDDHVSYSIFYILIHLKSTDGEKMVVGYDELMDKVEVNFSLFSQHLVLENIQTLTATYFDNMLSEFINSAPHWTKYSPELRLLTTVAVQSGPYIGERLDLFISLCKSLSQPEVEFEIKSCVFSLLNRLMENAPATLDSKSKLSSWSETILTEIIVNNLVWKAGRKAMLVRSFATELLLKFLSNDSAGPNIVGFLDKIILQSQLEKRILPNIISNLDEDIQKARQEDLAILSILLTHLDFEAPQIKILYPELLKRLDDSHDEIRQEALKTFIIFFRCIGKWLDAVKHLAEGTEASTVKDESQECGYREIRLDTIHWETMIKGMSIHLDDMNPTIQENCCEAFIAAVKVGPHETIRDVLTQCRPKHRTTKYIDVILSALP